MGRIIRPEAQPRWLLPQLSLITPTYVEAILRGALVGNHVCQWQLFDTMEDTWARLVKNLNEVKRAAIADLRERWRLQAWSEKDAAPTPAAEERARLVEEALLEMKGDAARNENAFDDTCYDILDAWGKGVSILEIDWEVRQAGKLGQIVAPRSTYWVHPKNYAWDGEGTLGLVPEGSRGGMGYGRTDLRMKEAGGLNDLPPDKFVVAISRARSGHPLGGALLRSLAWWWCAANFSADWLLNYAQIFGLPLRWTTYAPGVPQATIDAICDMLANMGSAGWAAFPEGTALEVKESAKGGENVPQAAVLDRADKQCDLLVLGQTLTTQVSAEGGSRALGEVHETVRRDVIHAAAGFLARVLNSQVVPAVLRLNYGDEGERPSFVPNSEEPEEAKANAEVLEIAVRAGIPVPVNFALEKLNIPKAEAGEDLARQGLRPARHRTVPEVLGRRGAPCRSEALSC
jgi:phage gp29-like protein